MNDEPKQVKPWNQSIVVLGPLSKRTLGILKENNIQTIGDLATMSEGDFLRLKNAKTKSLKEVRSALARIGQSFSEQGAFSRHRI